MRRFDPDPRLQLLSQLVLDSIDYLRSFELALRREMGLADFEVSRACKFLASSGLIVIGRSENGRRVRMLTPTKLETKLPDQVVFSLTKIRFS
jgi:hypothetical protein